MTNRGVLRAMTGDMTGAADDFTQATAMTGAASASGRNLARIAGAIEDRVAMTRGR